MRSSSPALAPAVAPAGVDRDLVGAVGLLEADVHPLGRRGRQVLADVVGADRQLAVAAVDQHRELHPGGAAVVEEGVDRRRARCAPCRARRRPGRPCARRARSRGGRRGRPAASRGLAALDVVAVEGDVEVAERDLRAGELADQRVQALGRSRRRACGCRPAPGRSARQFFSTISWAIRTSVRRRSS